MSKFKTFISNYSISIAACVLTLMLVGVWHIFANPTKTIIGDDVIVSGSLGVGTASPQARLDVAGGDNSFAWGGDHSGTGYIRIGDLQIAWGSTSITGQGTHENSKTITYPASFSSTPLVTTTMQNAYTGGSAQWSTNAHAVTTSGARLSLAYWNGAYSGTYTVAYIAIGTWQ
jgi:hypothetical protein